jgi:hypothetical protein
MMTQARLVVGLAVALLAPGVLEGQACLGVVGGARGWIGARAAQTSLDPALLGVELGFKAGPWVTVFGEGDLMRSSDGWTPDRQRVRVGAAFRNHRLSLPVCLTVSGGVGDHG